MNMKFYMISFFLQCETLRANLPTSHCLLTNKSGGELLSSGSRWFTDFAEGFWKAITFSVRIVDRIPSLEEYEAVRSLEHYFSPFWSLRY
jgi:hypothetical protein